MAGNLNLRPEDKPKVIGIVVGIVFVNIFVFSRIISGAQTPAANSDTKESASASAPAAQPAPSPAPSAGKTNAPVVAGADMKLWNKDETPPTPIGEDPFRPVLTATATTSAPAEAKPAPTQEAPTTKVAASATPTKSASKFVWKPKTHSQFANTASTTGILPPMSVGQLQVRPVASDEPLPEFDIKGVIMDDKAMVVLKMGDRSLYKNEGERLQGGIVIEKVTQEAITFRIGTERRVLAPGQSFKASDMPRSQATNF